MVTVKAVTITVDSLLSRPKLDCDMGYDMAVKGASVVVCTKVRKYDFVEHSLIMSQIGSSTWHCFYPFGYIVHGHQDVLAILGLGERPHEINPHTSKSSTWRLFMRGIASRELMFPCF